MSGLLYAERGNALTPLSWASSHDGLSEWEAFRETSLPCPNSGIDAVRLADGRILLIYNHSNRMKVR